MGGMAKTNGIAAVAGAEFNRQIGFFSPVNGVQPPIFAHANGLRQVSVAQIATDGLSDLIEQPNNAPDWRGPYIKKGIPVDPWGNAYVYEYPGRKNSGGYDLSSNGPDGRSGGDDDITNWSK